MGDPLYILFIFLLFTIAFLYASVGHGGASGYLALMALFGVAPDHMKSSALIMNIFVSLIAFYGFYRNGYFNWKLFLPFALGSVPASFMGAFLTVDALIYKRILGVLLIFPVLHLLGFFGKKSDVIRKINWTLAILIGAGIGFLSGMIGIGGGILLSPLILLLRWGTIKETAAVSSLFIFLNSISGLVGLLTHGTIIDASVYLWVAVALAGGLTGSQLGSKRFSNPVLKRILACVIVIASVKLLTLPEHK